MPPKRSTNSSAKSAAAASAPAKATKPRGRTTAPKQPLQEAKANMGAKRKADVEPEQKTGGKRARRVVEAVAPVEAKPVAKTAKKDKTTVAAAKKEAKKEKVVINKASTTRLEVFVFGSNSNGELGLGDTFKKADCPRPRFNSILTDAGVVQVSCGGMHGVALTHDNKILTWGVNDQGALGRDTTWEGGLVDIEKAEAEDSDDDEDEIEVNPREATPTMVDLSAVAPGTVFTQVIAADSASFALTDDGYVYGWGTFRGSNGIFGFSPKVEVQHRPTLIPGLQRVTKIVSGSNHVVALLSDGTVHAWGSGEQDQLGRRILERRAKQQALLPQKVGLRRGVVDIATGADHSFAVHKDGTVYGWGLNNYGQTGIPSKAGESEAAILKPAAVSSLKGHSVTRVDGGNFNSLAVTDKHECLVWGRIDNHAIGIDPQNLPEDNVIFDERGKPRILTNATPIPGLDVAYAALGTEHAIAVTKEGQVYSWGFNSSNQTGQPGDDDIKVATLIDSKSVREKKFIWSGAGGQYGMMAAKYTAPTVNGVA